MDETVLQRLNKALQPESEQTSQIKSLNKIQSPRKPAAQAPGVVKAQQV